MIVLAAMLLVQSVAGCRGDGRTVRCTLAPPVRGRPAPAAMPEATPKPMPRAARSRRLVISGRTPIAPQPQAPAPDDAEIARHVASLAAIGDCTGVRTYFGSIGLAARGTAAFMDCVAPPSAITTSPKPGTVATVR